MLYSTVLLATVLVAAAPSPDPSGIPFNAAGAPSIRASIARMDLVGAAEPRPELIRFGRQGPAPRAHMSTPMRVLFTALAGAGGFFAGGVIGAAIDGDCGGCDDPGFKGALIGAPVGAASAAITAWVLTGR